MKKLIIVALFLSQFVIQAQRHFSLSMKLTVQSDTVFCDVTANDDYPIAGFQFGFNHDLNKKFIEVQQITIPGIDSERLRFNEVCSGYIRILWANAYAKHTIRKGDVLFRIIYKELITSKHNLCMIPSYNPTGNHCTYFIREALDLSRNYYIVDDICIDYEVANGQVVVSTNNNNENNINVCLNGQCDKLLIDSDDFSNLNDVRMQLININGKECINLKLESTLNQQIDITKYPSGLYVYKIFSGNKNLKTGKIFLAK